MNTYFKIYLITLLLSVFQKLALCQWILLKQENNYKNCDDYFSVSRSIDKWTAQRHSDLQDSPITSCLKICDVQGAGEQFNVLYLEDYNILRNIRLDFPHCRIKIDLELVKIGNWDSTILQSSYVQVWLEDKSIYKWNYDDILNSEQGTKILCQNSISNDFIKNISIDISHQNTLPLRQLLSITHPKRAIGLKSFQLSYIPCHESCNTCNGPNSTDCLSCADPNLVLLGTGECIQQQCNIDSGYVKIQKVCQRCYDSNCLSCLDDQPNSCTKCYNSWFLDQMSCKVKCRDGFYSDSKDKNKCKRCSEGCRICEGSQNYCLSCDFGYDYLGNHTCVKKTNSSCAIGNYTDENGICSPCDPKCLDCYGNSSGSVCYICDKSAYSIGNTCTINCPIGYYKNPYDQICTKCSVGCDDCSSYSNCTKCSTSASPPLFLLDSTRCVETCPKGMFGDSITNTCIQCLPNCQDCTNQSNCSNCNQGYYLNSNPHPNVCLPFCGGSPPKCIDVHISCGIPQIYDFSQQTCRPCPKNCNVCDEDGRCIQCQSNVPAFKLINNQCTLSLCNSNQYYDGVQCQNCSDRCIKCKSLSSCLECKPSYFLVNNYCQNQLCANNFYYDFKTDTCVDCLPECITCSSKSICLSCNNGYTLKEYTCESNCPSDQFFNLNTLLCEPCPQYCSKCNQQQICSSCVAGSTLYFNQYCYPTCQPNQYFSTKIKKCDDCPYGCSTCDSFDICITCLPGFTKDGQNKCVKDCGIYRFYNQQTLQCEACPNYCATCSSLTFCSTCIPGKYTRKDNLCVPTDCLQPNQYFDSIKLQCVVCDINCNSCKSATQCKQCIQGYYADAFGQCEEAPSIQFYLNTQVDSDDIYIYIMFNHPILVSDPSYSLSSLFQLSIKDISQSEYSYSMSLSDNGTKITIKLKTNATIKNKSVTVYSTNRDKITDRVSQSGNLEQKEYTTTIENYYPISDQDKDQADKIKTVGQVVSGTMLAGIVPLALIGYFSALASFLDITQLIQYLFYANVRYPYNLNEYFKIFQNFDLDFLPNVFVGSYPSGFNENNNQQSPQKFNENGKSALFLANAGQNYFILIVVVGLHLIVRSLRAIFVNKDNHLQNKIGEILAKLCSFFEFNAYVMAMFEIFFNLMASSFLQVWDMPTDQSYELLSMFLVITSLIGAVTYVLFAFIYLKNNNIETLKNEEKKYGELWQNLRVEEKQINKYYYMILYGRKFFFALFIVGLYDFTYVQLTLISVLNLILIYFVKKNNPLHLKITNYVDMISEFLLIIAQILIMVLKEDPDDQLEDERVSIGWGIIFVIAFILGLQVCAAFYEVYLIIKALILKRQQQKDPVDSSQQLFQEQSQLSYSQSKPKRIDSQNMSAVQDNSSIYNKIQSKTTQFSRSEKISKIHPFSDDSKIPIERDLFSPSKSSSSRELSFQNKPT